MSGLILVKPCREEHKSRYCFPCISGLCPYEMDFMTECFPELDYEQRSLFEELFTLRAEIARASHKEYAYCIPHSLSGETK